MGAAGHACPTDGHGPSSCQLRGDLVCSKLMGGDVVDRFHVLHARDDRVAQPDVQSRDLPAQWRESWGRLGAASAPRDHGHFLTVAKQPVLWHVRDVFA